MRHDEDRGLAAVRRVRDARERDSRLGLQQAFTARRLREAEAERARVRLGAAPAFAAGSAAAFRAHIIHVTALAEQQADAERRADSSRVVADEATRRWLGDRQAVRVVDLLLERRAEERRADRTRREARELDDLAAQGWLRRAGEGSR